MDGWIHGIFGIIPSGLNQEKKMCVLSEKTKHYSNIIAEVQWIIVCDALQWNGIRSRVYSALSPRVPGMDSRSIANLTRIMRLLKMNELVN